MERLHTIGQLMQQPAASSGRPAATARRSNLVDDAAVCAGLAAHLGREFGGTIGIEGFTRKSAGFSWITYSFVTRPAAGPVRRLILRVGPPNGLFAPYSIMPQVLALQSLAGTRVPVPALVSFDQEGAEIGFPFFICEHVEGEVPAPWAGSAVDEGHRLDIARQFITVLGELHRLDWRDRPLASLRGDGREREEVRVISAWRALLDRSTARYYPLLDWGGRWLAENCPLPPRTTIVHGDYRIGNFLECRRNISAILDWELAHLGDPHEDLSWALMPTFNAGSRKLYGVVEREEVADLYARVSGIPVSPKSFAFYEAFALYQAAAIQMCAVRAFEVDHFNDMRMAVMASQMPSIVRALERALEAAA